MNKFPFNLCAIVFDSRKLQSYRLKVVIIYFVCFKACGKVVLYGPVRFFFS